MIPQFYAWGFPSDHAVCPRCRHTIDISPRGRCNRESCGDAFPKFFLINTRLLKARYRPRNSRCFSRNCNSVCRLAEKCLGTCICRAFDDGAWNFCAPFLEWSLAVATILKRQGPACRKACLRIRKFLIPRVLEEFNPNVNGSILAGLVRDLMRVWHSPALSTSSVRFSGAYWMEQCPFVFNKTDLSDIQATFRSFLRTYPSMNARTYECMRNHCGSVLSWTKQLRILLPVRVARVVWKIANKTIDQTLRGVPPAVYKSLLPASKGDALFNTTVWSSGNLRCHTMHTNIAKCSQKLLSQAVSACTRLVDDIECGFWPLLASCLRSVPNASRGPRGPGWR